MRSNRDSAWWKRPLAGMAAGASGTAAMDLYMKAARRAGGHSRQPQPKGHDISLFGRKHKKGESSTAALGRLAYHALTNRKPDHETAGTLSGAVHWTYGIQQGAVYALLRGKAGTADLLGGAAFGAGLWVLGDELVIPLLGLAEGPKAYPASTHALTLGAHVVYGVTTAAATHLLERVL